MKTSTTDPRNYIELLEVFRIGLINGLVDKDEIIKWADSIIQQDEQPDSFIIELSLCCSMNINDVVSIINEFIGESKPVISGRVILGLAYRLYNEKRIVLRKVTSTIDWLTWHGEPTEKEKSLMYGLDEELNCAESGIYGTIEGVEEEVLLFLEIYKDFSIDNFSKWSEINKTIDQKAEDLVIRINAERDEMTAEYERQQAKKNWWKFWIK